MSETQGGRNEKEVTPHNDVVKSGEADDAAPSTNVKESKEIESEMDTDNAKQMNSTVDINTLTPSTPSQTPPQLLAAEATATTTTASSGTTIPENILSPPKSETQTDETNTATSTSCSPASEGQRSPVGEVVKEPTTPKLEQKQELSATVIANGSIPKSGKPLVTALNKKLNKSASTSPRASRARKPKALPMYESEISDNKMGIKLCIKKSDAIAAPAELSMVASPVTLTHKAATPASAPSKQARKRVRKPKPQDSDESEYEPRKKRGGGGGGGSNNGERQKKLSTQSTEADVEPVEQSAWGHKLPEEVLFRVRIPYKQPLQLTLKILKFKNV